MIPTASMSAWEQRLIDWAYEGLREHNTHHCMPPEDPGLRPAYAQAAAITREHSRTFYLASELLPPSKRRAARALYAFCRLSDDLVDTEADLDPRLALEPWRQMVVDDCPSEDDLVALAWADTRERYDIPRTYAEQLIDGVARDLHQSRYATFDDLAAYCYGVASTVGLMAMHIVGYEGPEAIPYAVKLGVALQLTNVLRDVNEDWSMGRLYLPLEDLETFDLSEKDVACGVNDRRWKAFMTFQIRRVRRLYAESLPGIRFLHPDGRFAIAAAAELYCAILDDIEAHEMDVFSRRAYTTLWDKIKLLPRIWWRARISGYTPGEERV
ncbi:MAG: phytoene/squalene synthase family protein [Anaerolineae bacterium]